MKGVKVHSFCYQWVPVLSSIRGSLHSLPMGSQYSVTFEVHPLCYQRVFSTQQYSKFTPSLTSGFWVLSSKVCFLYQWNHHSFISSGLRTVIYNSFLVSASKFSRCVSSGFSALAVFEFIPRVLAVCVYSLIKSGTQSVKTRSSWQQWVLSTHQFIQLPLLLAVGSQSSPIHSVSS